MKTILQTELKLSDDSQPIRTLQIVRWVGVMLTVKYAAEIDADYLLSDFVINPSMKDISRVPQGSFDDLYQYFLTLPKAEPVI